ncbi:MAG: hypothetical protein LBH43_21925 [Treponema sp.]|nr:hypothetical protein [Treponema sp.]
MPAEASLFPLYAEAAKHGGPGGAAWLRLFGVIAIAALIGVSTAACDDGGGGGGGGASHLGDTPALSGPVYVMYWIDDSTEKYEAYTGGKLNVSVDGLDEKGTIENGQFSFTLGTPKTEYLEPADDIGWHDFFWNWNDVEMRPSNAKYFIIDWFDTDSNDSYGLKKFNEKINYTNTSVSGTDEVVAYVYVDKDCGPTLGTLWNRCITSSPEDSFLSGGSTLLSAVRANSDMQQCISLLPPQSR